MKKSNPLGFAVGAISVGLVGCATGEGSGSVTSDKLYVANCWDGPFDLQPTFFATVPFGDTQEIRVQRGDRNLEVSDGVQFIVNHTGKIRSTEIGTPIELGLPVGVRPPGFPVQVDPTPPEVSMTLYLYDTCHVQNGALYAISGSITFSSLFSGNRNENSADRRLTSAEFDATVADPRDATITVDPTTGQSTVDYTPEHTSQVHGTFKFYFQRGVPAQPFP